MLERTLYQRLYKAPHLDQVMFSIGLVFMAVAAATWFFGPSQQPVRLPDFLRGQVRVLGLDLGAYRLFLIGVVVVVTIALHLLLVRTRFGAQVRASVDNAVASARPRHRRQPRVRRDVRAGIGARRAGRRRWASTCWASTRRFR